MFDDIQTASFDQIVSFYFRNSYSLKRPNDWYLYIQFQYDPVHNARFFIDLFRNSATLREKFDAKEIDKGFWVLQDPAFDGNVYDVVLQDNEVSFDLKQQCVIAMYDLFKDLFAIEQVEASAFWWNKFAGHRRGAAWALGEPAQLADTIFGTLLRILRLDSDYCRSCALDAISKLRHRNTAEELKAFLRQNNRIDSQTRSRYSK